MRALWFLLLGWFGAVLAWPGKSESEDEYSGMGRDTWLEIPLYVRDEFRPKLRRMRQRRLKQLVRQVPVYASLLDEYPTALVTVLR